MRKSSIAGVVTVSAVAAFGLAAPATMAATSPTSGVEVAWKVDSSWTAGFQANATVINRTNAPLNPWTIDLALGHQVTSVWDATNTAIPGGYRISGPTWANQIAPGGRASFGLVATKVGTSALAPTGCAVAGTTCTVTGHRPRPRPRRRHRPRAPVH